MRWQPTWYHIARAFAQYRKPKRIMPWRKATGLRMSMSAIRTATRRMWRCSEIFSESIAGAISRAAGRSNPWKEAIAVRQANAAAELVVLEGYDGAQP